MSAINSVASVLNRCIDFISTYLKDNAVAIIVLVLVWRFLRMTIRNRYGGHTLSSSSGTSTGTAPKKEMSRQEEMRRARERQQKLADERSKEAAIQRKEQETKEKDRRNHVAKPKKGQSGNGGSTSSAGGRNPLQPWASNGPSYRPARRPPPGGA